MRKRKFRGYDKIADTWCFGQGAVEDKDIKGRFHIMFNETDRAIIDDVESIGEYTGLKDKNGMEIYEGDICKRNGHVYKIGFAAGAFSIMKTNSVDRLIAMHHGPALYNFLFGIEVIGNVFENPELLNAK